MKNIGRHRVESDAVDMDFTLDGTGLIGALEVSGDAVAVLCDLYVFDLDPAVRPHGGVNRPVALHVVWRLLGESGFATNQRARTNQQPSKSRSFSS